MQKALVVLRRDLRLEDNTALNAALAHGGEVSVCFCIDPRQVSETNRYRSSAALLFLRESLEDLFSEIQKVGGRLTVLYGIAEEELPRRARENGISHLYLNKDYTPFAIDRDKKIVEACENVGSRVTLFDDALLTAPHAIQNAEGKPFAVFTRFYQKAAAHPVSKPHTESFKTLSQIPLLGDVGLSGLAHLETSNAAHPQRVRGGRTEALRNLTGASSYTDYKNARDFPGVNGTTRLSAHLKFGTLSPREVYWALRDALGGSHADLTRQLYWRDFFTHVAFHHPEVFGHAYDKKYDHLVWNTPGEQFEAWKRGETGFPIVDAGMRELNETGYMHNRVRMITASFLTKDLHLNWLLGEHYFATKLTDYDPALNNGNWQWVAGTGCDAQPWFRIFNPWLQQKRFDPECVYIKKWIPELADVPPTLIHTWYESFEGHQSNYPAPIVDHKTEAEETKKRYGRK